MDLMGVMMESVSAEVMDAIDFVVELQLDNRATLLNLKEGYIDRITENLPYIQQLQRKLNECKTGGKKWRTYRTQVFCCLFYAKSMDSGTLYCALRRNIEVFSSFGDECAADEDTLIEIQFLMQMLEYESYKIESVCCLLRQILQLRTQLEYQLEYQTNLALALI